MERYQYYESIVNEVDMAVQKIKSLDMKACFDSNFLEHEFIPSLGLNNEALNEQPQELKKYFGKGLHIWQYPNQLSKYLVWLAYNASNIQRYVEIGC